MTKSTPVEESLLRIALIRRGLSTADLAARMKMGARSLRTQIAASFPSRAGRLKIEAALDYEEAIFSSASQLAARKRCRDIYGVDPVLLRLAPLRSLAARMKLPGAAAHTAKTDLENAILLHLALTTPKNP